MDNAQTYADLKQRIAKMEASRQYLQGRQAAHEANKAQLLSELKGLGMEVVDLREAKAKLESTVAESLRSLEENVTNAEKQFSSLRSCNVSET